MTAATDGGSGGDVGRGGDRSDADGGVLPPPGRSPLLVAFVAAVFFALGWDAGMAGPVALAIVGALGVVSGNCLLGRADARARVLGSTIVASSLVGLSIAVPVLSSGAPGPGSETALIESPRRIGSLLAVAGGVGGVGFAVLVDRGGRETLYEALRDGAVGALLATPILLVVVDGRFFRSLRAAGGTLVEAWTGTPAVALLSLQVLALVALATAVLARSPLDRLTPWQPPIPSPNAIIDRFRSTSEIGYWLVLGYVAVWFVPGVLPAIDAAITSLGPVGVVVGTLLQSGVGHGLLLAASGLFLVVAVGYGSAPPVRRWLEPTPARTLSAAAGGFVVPVVVVVAGIAGTDHGLVRLGAVGSLPLVIAFLVGWLAAVTVGRIDVSRSRVLGIASASLFAATMGLAVDGLSSIGVLTGVAAVILAWDLGTNALSMHRSVGPGVDAREPIATHATAVVGVLAAGVGLGGLAIVAATVGGRAITLSGATATIVLLLLGAIVGVATIAVRRPAGSIESLAPLAARGRRLASNPLVLSLCGVMLTLMLGWLVDPLLFAVGAVLGIVGLVILLGGSTDDRPVSPRQRF